VDPPDNFMLLQTVPTLSKYYCSSFQWLSANYWRFSVSLQFLSSPNSVFSSAQGNY